MEIELEALRARVASLEQEVAGLKAQVSGEEVVVLRTITREQAKQEVQELLATGETLYYSDIARRLRIDLPQVVELCQELEQEGAITVDGNAV